MLDLRLIRENLERVEENCRNRGVTIDFERFRELDGRRSALIQQVDRIRHRQNEVSATLPKEKDPARKQELIAEGRQLKQDLAGVESESRFVEERVRELQRQIPNLSHPAAPVGREETDNREVRRVGEPRRFDFEPLDHVELAERHDLIDFEGGSKVAGHGFYFLKNEAVLLELALMRYALDTLMAEGFTPVITPDLARDEVLEGIGFLPRGPETQIYSIAGSDLGLIATAEITLGGLLQDQVLEESQLPIKLAGISHCFRTEAGAHGRATRGLYRVHQFSKVEMFTFTAPDQSDAMLERLVAIEERIFTGLDLPYRVLDTCTGDLGGPAYRKFDLEAWMPGRMLADTPTAEEARGAYGEVTSASNCTDYQARRLGIRFREKGKKGLRFVHTLNGTAIAVSRALIAILENHQQADGTIAIPEVLRPWVGKDKIGA